MRLAVFSAWAGMFLAPVPLHPVLAFTAILCIAVGAGASAALNNAYDADIDRIMRRTAWRPTASGRIAPAEANAFGLILAILSVVVMGLALNWLAASLLAATIAFYVLVYTIWLKRRTPQNIVIGGAAGALPPVVGWAAATGGVALEPLILFLLVFLWTPPHFWALALYRRDDYAAAGVPMLPVVAGGDATRRQILSYTVALVPVVLAPYVLGMSGPLYLVVALVVSVGFVRCAWRLLRDGSAEAARGTFRFSLLYLFALFAALVVDHALLAV
jgi:protoheme IX farnesyltransferase